MNIIARNNLPIPIRLTLTESNGEILITMGIKGVALKHFYSVCIDTDLSPNTTWEVVGSWELKTEYTLSLRGKEEK